MTRRMPGRKPLKPGERKKKSHATPEENFARYVFLARDARNTTRSRVKDFIAVARAYKKVVDEKRAKKGLGPISIKELLALHRKKK